MSDSSNSADVEQTGPVVIGISFGNSNSSIAVTSQEGKAEVIANEDGDRQIPSVLSYVKGDEFHGAEAKAQLVRNPTNTVAYFRDFLGKNFADIDPTHAHASAHPVDVESVPSFNIVEKDGAAASTLSVSEITTRHLRRLIGSASDFIGKKVTGTVISVPTDFNESQKTALVEAAKNADVEVLQLIQEPAAAALAYAAKDNGSTEDKTILVADIGGTRSDAAVIAVRGGMYTILATVHDYELGGAQLDKLLVDHFSKEFIKKHEVDPRQDARALAKLKLECELVKRTLSIATTAPLAADSLYGGFDFHSTINRLRFEILSKNVFDQVVKLAENVVKKAELDLLDIDTVILSGGSSHIPKIAQRVRAIFPPTTAIHAPAVDTSAINPSELSALGAAVQASLVAEYEVEDIKQSEHPAVTVAPHLSHAVGVLIGDKDFHAILPSNTAVPARRSVEFPVSADGDVVIKFAEGESYIHVEKPEPKEKAPKAEDEEEDSDEDSDEEEEETREKRWKATKTLAEARLQGVKKGDKIEISLTAAADAKISIAARVVGTQNGVRGVIEASA